MDQSSLEFPIYDQNLLITSCVPFYIPDSAVVEVHAGEP